MRLMRASIGDFQRDSLARGMRRHRFACAGWFVRAGLYRLDYVGRVGHVGLYSIKTFQPGRVHLWRHPHYKVKKYGKTPLMRGRKTPLPQRGPAARHTLRFPGMIFRM